MGSGVGTKRFQVLHDQVMSRPGAAQRIAQHRAEALAEIELYNALAATDEYLADLAAEVGDPSVDDRAQARAIVRRLH
jgi:hypothetical protein